VQRDAQRKAVFSPMASESKISRDRKLAAARSRLTRTNGI
jgi:hypothetical protein